MIFVYWVQIFVDESVRICHFIDMRLTKKLKTWSSFVLAQYIIRTRG